MKPLISFITVQYNNPLDTAAFVSSVSALRDVDDCEVVVVDNSTSAELRADSARLQAKAVLPVQVVTTSRNLYYWGAAEFAINKIFGRGDGVPEWLAISNNDIAIEDPDFIAKLRAIDGIASPIVAPRITTSSGREQNPFFESPPPFLKKLKWRIYDLDYRIARSMLYVHSRIARSPARKAIERVELPRRIYAPHGAFVLLSSQFFKRGGTLDTRVPLFAEELTLAVAAERLGIPVWYHPQLQVFHREHSTTGHALTRSKYEFERSARKRYYSMLAGATGNDDGISTR